VAMSTCAPRGKGIVETAQASGPFGSSGCIWWHDARGCCSQTNLFVSMMQREDCTHLYVQSGRRKCVALWTGQTRQCKESAKKERTEPIGNSALPRWHPPHVPLVCARALTVPGGLCSQISEELLDRCGVWHLATSSAAAATSLACATTVQ
jgi:hypothetical protein